MFAYRFTAFVGIAMEFGHATFHVVFLFLENLQIYHIARYGVLCKNNEVVCFGNGFTFGGDIGDGYFLKKRKLFLFANHKNKIKALNEAILPLFNKPKFV